MRPLHIFASQATTQTVLEWPFLQLTLLDSRPVRVMGRPEDCSGNDAILIVDVFEPDLERIRELTRQVACVGYIQLGDEFNVKRTKELSEIVNFIFRPYFFSDLFLNERQNVFWIPNGYASGIGPRHPERTRPAHSRKFLSCFLGWLGNNKSFNEERIKFSMAAESCREDLLLLDTEGFGRGFGNSTYGAVMEDSILAPCPAGNSPETIRLYDALECGCIPIALRHEFLTSNKFTVGVPPFPIIDSWEELPRLLRDFRSRIVTDRSYISALQSACIGWWGLQKNYSKNLVDEKLIKLLS
jgi:hypothetical protein